MPSCRGEEGRHDGMRLPQLNNGERISLRRGVGLEYRRGDQGETQKKNSRRGGGKEEVESEKKKVEPDGNFSNQSS